MNINIFKKIKSIFSRSLPEENHFVASSPQFLYDSSQQRVLNLVQSGKVLELNEVMVIINDANVMKLSKPQGINIDTMEYELDKELINNFIKSKYGYPIYYKSGNHILKLVI